MAALAIALGAPDTAPAATPDGPVRVHIAEVVGPANPGLAGIGWNTGALEAVEPLRPSIVRIDASLDRVSPEPGRLELERVLDDVARVRRLGAEPLVLLYPMPRWLGEGSVPGCTPGPFNPVCDPTRMAPSDFDAWSGLIRDVVRALATADAPAKRFEVWNEPDLPVFWQGTREEFLRTALATHAAVADVEAETGIDLEVGGPASASPGGAIEPYVRAVAEAGLPLDFVSWHHYGNAPLLGPDGNEGLIPDELYRQLAGINPRTTPRAFGEGVATVRKAVRAGLGGSSATPALILDEWNLSSGGYDLRHDSNQGAAFALAVLVELERAGADAAAYYRAISGSAHPGDWGLVTSNGRHKPAWSVLAAWAGLEGARLRLDGDDPAAGLWARATSSGTRVDVLLATFVATGGSGRGARLEIVGPCRATTAEVRAIRAGSSDFSRATVRTLRDGSLDLDLADQSATWVRLDCARPAARSRALPLLLRRPARASPRTSRAG